MQLKTNENEFFIRGEAGQLQAILARADQMSDYIAIVCHPNPQQQGSMQNKVVTTLCKAFHALNIDCIRFNYRGIGQSQGEFANTIGEAADLKAVIADAKTTFPDKKLILAGFSFGAYIARKVADEIPPLVLISIAPPVNFYDFTILNSFQKPWLVVQGDADEVVPYVAVKNYLDSLNPKPSLIVFKDGSHFFHGRLIELQAVVMDFLQNNLL